ncbi:hypothetical protein [Tunturiibacter lichenicola]|uniref:hypothetical protein n=1 Tax=Tunturiibacter lichenicola TaxID=2051959 RepID=UPI003D9B848B
MRAQLAGHEKPLSGLEQGCPTLTTFLWKRIGVQGVSVGTGEGQATNIEQMLEQLATSAAFERSSGLLKLLRFLIEASEREPDLMRESYIGRAFYGRDATYDPRYDSIVRVNVRRLRQRHKEHYAGEGSDAPIRINIPRGSFVPIITDHHAVSAERDEGAIDAPATQAETAVATTEDLAENLTEVFEVMPESLLGVAASSGSRWLFCRWGLRRRSFCLCAHGSPKIALRPSSNVCRRCCPDFVSNLELLMKRVSSLSPHRALRALAAFCPPGQNPSQDYPV